MTLDLAGVGAGDFEPHVGSAFAVSGSGDGDGGGGGGFSVVLAEVSRRPAGGPTREPFTLTFAGGPNPPSAQGMHRLEHDVLGGFDLFLVPIGPGADGRHRYEAVFG
ncbi:hypothetical protein [Terrabacter sp. Soil810]|uniref:DUF6916 family protein n=1 Tax=Terrabacter sp. Soil810 TaxID=1736418 RepID=UPI00070EC73E|nr:hypothetical protein [Terrabacter sp. Soil810]KRF38915.1 hypothetical protein ASG96_16205 [Terrabacter sp. Soil810]